MSDICRLCGDFKLLNILKNINDKYCDVQIKLKKYFHISLDPAEMLPNTVCFRCIEELNKCCRFADQVVLVQEKFTVDRQEQMNSISFEYFDCDSNKLEMKVERLDSDPDERDIEMEIESVHDDTQSVGETHSVDDSQIESNSTAAKKSRKSYTIQEKLEAIRMKVKTGRSYRSVAKEMGINDTMLRKWHLQEQTFKTILQDPTKSDKIVRQNGGGQKPMYPELEAKVVNAIAELQREGVPITNRMIFNFSLKFKTEMLEELAANGDDESLMKAEELKIFKISNGWMSHFKRRYVLKKRSHLISDGQQPEPTHSELAEQVESLDMDLFEQYSPRKEAISQREKTSKEKSPNKTPQKTTYESDCDTEIENMYEDTQSVDETQTNSKFSDSS
jgi:transposase-like protein